VGDVDGTGVVETVLDGGVDVIEHVPLPIFSAMEGYELINDSGHYTVTAQSKDQLARLAASGVVMVPTLTAHTPLCDAAQLTPLQKKGCFEFLTEPVRIFYALGGKVALGNDWGAGDWIKWGMPLPEMELLLAAGLTPMDVLRAGTQHAAWVCGHGDELGTLAPGMLADVIVVDGDPLTDMQAMGRVVAVVKGGQVVSSKTP
jgi:imidazolonepropionase-like amidohydrolase